MHGSQKGPPKETSAPRIHRDANGPHVDVFEVVEEFASDVTLPIACPGYQWSGLGSLDMKHYGHRLAAHVSFEPSHCGVRAGGDPALHLAGCLRWPVVEEAGSKEGSCVGGLVVGSRKTGVGGAFLGLKALSCRP